jgi:hypothetical protein
VGNGASKSKQRAASDGEKTAEAQRAQRGRKGQRILESTRLDQCGGTSASRWTASKSDGQRKRKTRSTSSDQRAASNERRAMSGERAGSTALALRAASKRGEDYGE